MTALRATYRLQLNKDFTFADAEALVPYLAELGVSHVYLSPILMARPGSTHGYDTVDHTRINPELGTLQDFRKLAASIKQACLGIILDFVPNHMGVGGADNPLWLDVLKHGPHSQYAAWFDIDWTPPRQALHGKILVPFLGKTYAESLADGDLELRADGDTGFAVWAGGSEKLPIRDQDAQALLALNGNADATIAAFSGTSGHAALDGLIATQYWRLVHYSAGAEEMNYRRFFINSDLGGITIDRPDVFDHAHNLIFQLIEEGLVDGLRIDHVDGLLDPKGYLETLRAKTPRPILLFIEKILAPHERLRSDWPVDGTTGYEFGAQLTRLLIPTDAEEDLSEIYQDFVGLTLHPEDEAFKCKLRVMDNELAAELNALGRHFAAVAWSHAETRDLTEIGLRKLVREIIAHLVVYRPYIDDTGASSRDLREIGLAIAKARHTQPQFSPALFDFAADLFSGALGNGYDPRLIAVAIGKFQQFTGPVMAKGLEDTALYRYNRLVALNEVGAHPDRFSLRITAFHDANQRRLAEHPDCLLATSTHDTKRGEDVRAIVGAIAEHPGDWDDAVAGWRDMLAVDGEDLIHPNDMYLIFQLLIGGWPAFGPAGDLAERIKGAMTKSLREARERSDWGVNNKDYEDRVSDFVDSALSNQAFIAQFEADRGPIAETGLRKALLQVALKLTVPGIPDIYRGAEDWEQSFVDPDNRRPVDFAGLAKRLAAPTLPQDNKLVLTQALLKLRGEFSDLFQRGSYEPIAAKDGVIAYRRRLDQQELVVVADLRAGAEPLELPAGIGTMKDVVTALNLSGLPLFVGYRG